MFEVDPNVKNVLKSVFYGVAVGVGTSIIGVLGLATSEFMNAVNDYNISPGDVTLGAIALGIGVGIKMSNKQRNPLPLVSISPVVPSYIESNNTIIQALNLVLP